MLVQAGHLVCGFKLCFRVLDCESILATASVVYNITSTLISEETSLRNNRFRTKIKC